MSYLQKFNQRTQNSLDGSELNIPLASIQNSSVIELDFLGLIADESWNLATPSVQDNGISVILKQTVVGATYKATVTTAGAETIDGGANLAFQATADQFALIRYDHPTTNWEIVERNW